MNLKKLLPVDHISLDLPGGSKSEVIEALVDLAMKSGRIRDRKAVVDSVQEREARMSTGIQSGIAIPHGRCDAVDDLLACMGISREGVDFGSLDGKPSRIFIMTISPSTRTVPGIQFLAEMSKILRNEDNRRRILEATRPGEILKLL